MIEAFVGSILLLSMVLTLVILGIGLAVLLLAGSIFLQGYFYTEANPGLLWQAPLAGVILTGFLSLWCVLNANAEDATPGFVRYDTLFRFSPDVKMMDEEAEYLWSIENKEKVKYKLKKIPQAAGLVQAEYRQVTQTGVPGRIWRPAGVEAIEIEHEGKTYRFEPQQAEDDLYRRFVSPEGWVMMEYETGITGLPRRAHTGLLFANLFLNFFHLALWFGCLWLLMRFQWSHALGLAIVMWAVLTLFLLPGLLTQAARSAQSTPTAASSGVLNLQPYVDVL